VEGISVAGKRKKATYSSTSEAILETLEQHPEGLDIHQLKELVLGPGKDQSQFDRRLRELDPLFRIARRQEGRRCVYSQSHQFVSSNLFTDTSGGISPSNSTNDEDWAKFCGNTTRHSSPVNFDG
jgi:hypothetical protein